MRTSNVAVIALVSTCLLGVGLSYAQASDDHGGGRTVTFVEVNHPEADVDVDLGTSGPSLGDEQVFHATLQRQGRDVGDVFGVGTVVRLDSSGLSSQVVSTAAFADGTFALQLLYRLSFQDGPDGTLRGAVTGGTGTYAGVTGECTSEPIAGTDNNRITCVFRP